MFCRRESVCKQLGLLISASLSSFTLAHCLAAGEPPNVATAPLQVTGNTTPGFTMIQPSQIGIAFSNVVARRSIHTLIANGLAAGDVDGDGLCDLYFCSS